MHPKMSMMMIKFDINCDPLWENVPYRNCVKIAKKTRSNAVRTVPKRCSNGAEMLFEL